MSVISVSVIAALVIALFVFISICGKKKAAQKAIEDTQKYQPQIDSFFT